MAQIPFYFKALNRTAVTIRPKKPFYDWVKYLYPEHDEERRNIDFNIYLIPEMDTDDQTNNWMKKNYDSLFSNELLDWNTDENNWPKKRTWKVFNEWFDFEISTMIMDTLDDEIEKD